MFYHLKSRRYIHKLHYCNLLLLLRIHNYSHMNKYSSFIVWFYTDNTKYVATFYSCNHFITKETKPVTTDNRISVCFTVIGANLSEPHINGVSSRNHYIPMVRRTYVVRHSNCKCYVGNSNCKHYSM